MSGAFRDEHGALIRQIGAAVQSALGSLATVTESPPDSTWQVSRLMIRPTSADAPAIGVWPEDEVIFISVADRVAARVDVTEGDPLTDITAIIIQVSRAGWTEERGRLWWRSSRKWPPYE